MLTTCLLLQTCQPQAKLEVGEVSFYYWQTQWQWEKVVANYVQTMQTKKMYIRFFDVDWNEHEKRAVPVSPLHKTEKQALSVLEENSANLPENIAIIPTIFITNRTMANLPDAEVESLAGKIWEKINAQKKQIFPTHQILSVQLDCDWSGQTREKYFKLCKTLKQKILPARLSVTIRLHQVRQVAQTGVPPADEGVLMCYNVGKIDGTDTQNSILDIDIMRSYVSSLTQYSLPLEIALPTFAWGVLKRGGRVVKLLPDIEENEFQGIEFEKINLHTFRVKKEHYRQGVYLYEGDELRIEKTNVDLLQKALQEIAKYRVSKKTNLIFYHLHKGLPAYFSTKDLEKIKNCSE